MKKLIIVFILALAVLAIFFLFPKNSSQEKHQLPAVPAQDLKPETQADQNKGSAVGAPMENNFPFGPPLEKAGERVTKKQFSVFITPQNSPVQPEKFRGYHTGADFEIFPDELNAEMAVKSICDGSVVLKKRASGYGGVLVQKCALDSSPITVVYGHLNLASIQKKVGDILSKGEVIGFLGKDKSVQTDGERKHLHLGMQKGSLVDIRGYVATKNELSAWLNPCDYVCR